MRTLGPAQRRGGKFLNPVETGLGSLGLTLKLLALYLTNKNEVEPKIAPGPFRTDPARYARPPASGLRVTWFGHSSLLLELDGVRVLIDPVWDERASPLSFLGPKRFFAPTIPLEDLPVIDAVLISHDHFDHLGRETVARLAQLRPGLRWVCPLQVGRLLQGFGVSAGQITELDWTGSLVLTGSGGAELRVTALPARHFSGRAVWNRFETLWACYVLAGEQHRVYYGADSGMWDGFEAIGAAFGPFDLTMLEIGAFHPLWSSIHMGPDGAAAAFATLGGGVLMPIHWGLFNLALHAWRQPIERMVQRADEDGIRLFSPTPGEPTELQPGAEIRSEWWK